MLATIRRFTLLAALLATAATVAAQVPTGVWASSPALGTGRHVVTDAAGNAYITGHFGGTADFGTYTLTSVGGEDLFVAKLAANGVYQWAVAVGGIDQEQGLGLALDRSGGVYVTGYFQSQTVQFGTTTLTNSGMNSSEDLFVAKLNPSGAWQWAVSGGGSGSDSGQGIGVDAVGNVFFMGSTQVTAAFGSHTVSSLGRSGIVVGSLTPAGTWRWVVSADGGDYDSPSGLEISPTNDIYVTGSFLSSTLLLGASQLTNAGVNTSDVFVAKLDTAGNWQWATRAGGAADEYATRLALDRGGNPYITGTLWGAGAAFGSTSLSSVGASDLFVARMNGNGSWRWAQSVGGADNDYGYGLAVDASANVYVTGWFDSRSLSVGNTQMTNASLVSYTDALILKADSAGNWQWATALAGTDNEAIYALAIDLHGNLVLTGTFDDATVSFGATTLTNSSPGAYAVFIGWLTQHPLGVGEGISSANLQLHPNPAHHTVQITNAPGPTAEILDVTGRILRTAALAPLTSTLDIRGLPPGLYVVRAGGRTRRLVVE